MTDENLYTRSYYYPLDTPPSNFLGLEFSLKFTAGFELPICMLFGVVCPTGFPLSGVGRRKTSYYIPQTDIRVFSMDYLFSNANLTTTGNPCVSLSSPRSTMLSLKRSPQSSASNLRITLLSIYTLAIKNDLSL